MQEIHDLRDALVVFKRHSRLILLSCAVGLLLGLLLSVFILPPLYSSGVSMYVNSASGESGTLNMGDIAASQKLAGTYIVILRDDEIMSLAAAKLSESYSRTALKPYFRGSEFDQNGLVKPSALRARMQMKAINDTEVLRIEAVTKSPVLSAALCNIFAELAPQVLGRVVKAGSVELIGTARVQNKPVFPKIPVFAAAGLILGLLFSVVAAMLLSVLDNTIKSAEDIAARYKLPVLGEIPDFSFDEKEGLDPYGG